MTPEQLGPYRIIRKLGHGGMGTVFGGVNVQTGEEAAVKLLAASLAQEEGFRVRFEAEIESLRKLNHPNIVRLFGFGEQEEHLFYAMELVDGPSLEEELTRGHHFHWREALEIGIDVCRALRHAHDRGVVHRDIKPGNLLRASDGCVKLSDFGIARLFGDSRRTHAGSVLGTAEFMAPEQAEGAPVGPKADLYSLGVVFYVLMSGRSLFTAGSLAEMLQKQRMERPEPLGRYVPDCPAEFEQLVMQLLEKEPDRRAANALLLGRRLAALRELPERTSKSGDSVPSANSGECDDSPAGHDDKAVTPVDPAGLVPTRVLDQPFLKSPPPMSAADALEVAARMPPTLAEVSAINDNPSAEPARPATAEVNTQGTVGAKTPGGSPRAPGRFVVVPKSDLDPMPEGFDSQRGTWSLAAILSAAAMIFGSIGLWMLLRPMPADALYEHIQKQVDGTTASLLNAENHLEDFVSRFPQDPRADEIRAWQAEIHLYRLERRLERRARNSVTGEGLLPMERAYLETINIARLDPEQGMVKLQALIDLYGGASDVTGQENTCLELARRRLKELQTASQQIGAGLLPSIRRRLEYAEGLEGAEPEQSRKIYRAVVELYGDKAWARGPAAQARSAIERLDARGRQ